MHGALYDHSLRKAWFYKESMHGAYMQPQYRGMPSYLCNFETLFRMGVGRRYLQLRNSSNP
jgi:hypothetical protein